ncbi:contractile injection system protein, VgrG/Pvc8 family [Corallococcus llansteffanensis]|uniref:Phage tail protein n=1 Tax=Corallococcus llansteffanensis TaxID=2316731 RepID=A0A3A8QHS4_9BACT|nr:contractile injection system protein, VgrG/Pvc8 family [Corallococcus llansteffanensis]RKH68279.1 hypothetical protein D7V93_01555 [Corallococcus llansteffanensis]
MARISYEVSVGSLVASSQPQKGTSLLRSLTCGLTMDGAGGWCSLDLVCTGAPPRPGEAAQVSLDAGSGRATVFTGEVLSTRVTPESARVQGVDGLTRLARLEVSEAYEQMSAGSIVRELVRKANLGVGTIEDGPRLPSYLLHQGPSALHYLRRLAEQCGFDLYTDGAGKVHFASPRRGGADHTFAYPKQVLKAELLQVQPSFDSMTVWGEGAASVQGTARGHWLVRDLASVSGKASLGASGAVQAGRLGKTPRTVRDGAVRSGGDAAARAQARMAAVGSRVLRGFVEVLGSPALKPGALVKIDEVPTNHPARALVAGKVLRVRGVRHSLGLRTGFITRMEF